MFCPYVRKTFTRATIIHYNNDDIEDGSVVHEIYTNAECKKEECGAWNDGKCCFNKIEN